MISTELPRTAGERDKAAESVVKEIQKKHGDLAIMQMKDRPVVDVPHIPIGIAKVDDDVLGIGGFPRGRIIEIYGPESGGKTTLSLNVIASSQRQGDKAAFVDAEHAFDTKWATLNGVNVPELYISQPDYGEQALEIAEDLIRSGAFGVVVIDSVAALVPKAELEGEMGDSNMGLQARLMSQAMRKLTAITAKSNTCVIFINQVRDKIGVVYGSPETTTGGRALKFYSSVRLDVRRIGAVKDGDTIIGNKVRVKGAKNKCAAPFREAELDLLFDTGFDTIGCLIEEAVEKGVINKSGAWYSYKTTRLAQGKTNTRLLLKDNEELLNAIVKDLHGSSSD